MTLRTPVLLIGFNRPDTMWQVFEAVKQSQPEVLYYAVDGPRPGKDEELEIQKVRDIIKHVDWQCRIHTLFRKKNVGCGIGPASAISWAFENEDRLIILEDDCVPSQSFFTFCDEMLERYKDDERINIISGRSHWHSSNFFDKQDYIFTHYAHTWGWATWKRAWNEFDIRMADFPRWKEEGGAENILPTKEMADLYNRKFNDIYNNIDKEVSHSWDSQWVYARMKNGGLGIVPCRNMIHNIGEGGTHTSTSDTMLAEEMPSPIRHPLFIISNREYELHHFMNHIQKKQKKNVQRLKNVVSRLLKS